MILLKGEMTILPKSKYVTAKLESAYIAIPTEHCGKGDCVWRRHHVKCPTFIFTDIQEFHHMFQNKSVFYLYLFCTTRHIYPIHSY